MADNRIKELRRKQRLTLEALAEMLGTSKQTIHRYENGTISNIPRSRVEELARALGTTPAILLGWDKEESRQGYEDKSARSALPMLGDIACGKPIFADEEHGVFVHAAEGLGADFCLRAKGDSMIGARIMDGDIVFIRQQSWVENGEIAAVIIGDEATLKRVYYYPDEEKLILSPENPHYAPLVYIGEELSGIRILGKAVAFQSVIK